MSSDNHFIQQERTAPSILMSASLNPAKMVVCARIRSMATPVHALLDFLVSLVNK